MKPWMVCFALFVCAAAQSVAPAPPQPAEETVKPEDRCIVEGTVVNSRTGEPLKKAHVNLLRVETKELNPASLGATTDAAGHFVLEEVNPGKYRLTAQRNGFANFAYGSRGAGSPGTQLTLTRARKLKDLVLRMIPQGVVTGRAVDEDGEPLARLQVQFLRPMYMNGRKTLSSNSNAQTDDRGEYRAFGLAPGKYYACAVYDPSGRMMQTPEIRKESSQEGYAPTFYPNAASAAQASLVDVASGAEVSGIDFRLSPVRTFHIAGKVTNLPNAAHGGVVMVMSRDSEILPWNTMKYGMVDDKGNFLVSNINPGSYTIAAQSYVSGSETQMAYAIVNVADSSVDGVQLSFSALPEIAGAVRGERGVELKDKGMIVSLQPETPTMVMGGGPGQVQDDGTFKVKVSLPDKYRLAVYPMPEGAWVKSIRLGETDYSKGVIDLSKGVTAGELTIVIAGNGAQIEGNVRDPKDQPSTSASVVLIPDERDNHLMYGMANTDQNGHFTLKTVMPGKYKLFAFDRVEYGQYEDPDFLKQFDEKGESIEVSAGDKSSKDLKLIVTDEDLPPEPPAPQPGS